MTRKVEDAQIIQDWPQNPSTAALAKKYKVSERAMATRIAKLRSSGVELPSKDTRSPFHSVSAWPSVRVEIVNYEARVNLTLDKGIIVVGSDAHFWPGERTTAFRGFLHFIRELKPRVVILNGDVFDGARISRFARIGWDKTPSVIDELKAVRERLEEIDSVCGNSLKYWPLGNHDARFETKLAQMAPEYEGIKGFHLKDHFAHWHPCWSVMVNGDVLIKHRWKGGKYATANNTLNAGVSMVTGHLHQLRSWTHTDESGTRYGVDTGTLAEPGGQQFLNYTEDGPKDWRSGFAVLTFHEGQLLQPELAKVHAEGEIDFRGMIVRV